MAVSPLVGLPTDCKFIGQHSFMAAGEKYARAAIDGAGVTPLLLPLLQPPIDARAWLSRLDGLLLTGAVSNIEPHHYSDEPSWPGNPHDPVRDANMLDLIPQAISMGLPILAICRGFQEVNVALGGTLHQKVHAQPGLLDHRENPQLPLETQFASAHEVTFSEGGWLEEIAGGARARVNSLHGQGVARLGGDLIVEALAPDGLIEAFRGVGPGFLLGVQWHPEWRVLDDAFYLGIFQFFGDACRHYAATRSKD
ncbi:gamma-glutamyl-gamma-aminobutyrate hydrolase family protein [Xanthomonas albilineans]|uniref:gamma-glutamyl-gamma-aminobutyrate hydrolase family protein n=1 Tax=Xanthomonas albilineans TaxID=29447 RepID=UPI0005F35A99|nr:gamma-glutamyl-gamma-aminobutyrate hydrolase family protein [Xanthomonas albilineans]